MPGNKIKIEVLLYKKMMEWAIQNKCTVAMVTAPLSAAWHWLTGARTGYVTNFKKLYFRPPSYFLVNTNWSMITCCHCFLSSSEQWLTSALFAYLFVSVGSWVFLILSTAQSAILPHRNTHLDTEPSVTGDSVPNSQTNHHIPWQANSPFKPRNYYNPQTVNKRCSHCNRSLSWAFFRML